jgi:hypothetical protein
VSLCSSACYVVSRHCIRKWWGRAGGNGRAEGGKGWLAVVGLVVVWGGGGWWWRWSNCLRFFLRVIVFVQKSAIAYQEKSQRPGATKGTPTAAEAAATTVSSGYLVQGNS